MKSILGMIRSMNLSLLNAYNTQKMKIAIILFMTFIMLNYQNCTQSEITPKNDLNHDSSEMNLRSTYTHDTENKYFKYRFSRNIRSTGTALQKSEFTVLTNLKCQDLKNIAEPKLFLNTNEKCANTTYKPTETSLPVELKRS